MLANGLLLLRCLKQQRKSAKLYGLQPSEISLKPSRSYSLDGDPLELIRASQMFSQWINMASRQTRLFDRYKNLDVAKDWLYQ